MDDLVKRLEKGVVSRGDHSKWEIDEADEIMGQAAARITALESSSRSSFTRGAEAMKEMAAAEADRDVDDQGFVMIRPYHEIAAAIRALPTPEESA